MTDARMSRGTGEASDRRRVTVVGGGQMGAGIAHAFLLAGAHVVLVEASESALGAAVARVDRMVGQSVDRGVLHDAPPVVARLRPSTRIDDATGSDLVVEAVPEIVILKLEVLTRLDHLLGGAALLATNTSSISIDELATALEHPGSFCGMHFFNPVPASSLVEVVRSSVTATTSVDRAREWVDRMGKTAIVVRDSPGFASSRLGVALGLEAIRMVEEGVARPEDIDRAMTLGYKHPVGPLRLTDLVGLDVRLDIATYLADRLGPRFSAPRLLRDKVAAGELGRKTGRGFYSW